METTEHGWRIIDGDAGILSYEYHFDKEGTANTFAARMADGRMLVISPASRMPAGAFGDLERFGEVGAVLASNGWHYLGIKEWKDRYPKARFFADPLAQARIAKKSPDSLPLENPDDLATMTGPNIKVTNAPATKCGETWAWAKGTRGYVWFTGDILANFPSLPGNFFVRSFFRLTGTKEGYGIFHTAMKFIVDDKDRVLRELRQDMKEHPPSVVVPGHGPLLDDADLPARSDALFA
ncbi:MAG: hypothetical protein KC416_16545 [Myxococcales bacterium]|nr:hypothetical protein [Myxococcales bacterium]